MGVKTKQASSASAICDNLGISRDLVDAASGNADLQQLVMARPPREWFSVWDLLSRLALAFALFYYILLTRPVAFLKFTWRFNCIYYYTIPGTLLTAAYPVLPFVLCAYELCFMAKSKIASGVTWMSAGPGGVFFTDPEGAAPALLWKCWLNVGMYVSSYLVVGSDPVGVEHTWYDSILTKDFWFELGERTNSRFPCKVFTWEHGKLAVNDAAKFEAGVRVCVKLVDSYLGIGDMLIQQGSDFKTRAELVALLRDAYGNSKRAIATEFVVADPALGVHQSDILTYKVAPGAKARVLRVMYWGGCTGETSHSSTCGYMVDVETETIAAPAQYYSPSFLKQGNALVGTKLPGLRAACAKACEMHDAVEHPWVGVIGWDCMATDGNGSSEYVFFEGNLAVSRIRRHCYGSVAACVGIATHFAPPPFTAAYATARR